MSYLVLARKYRPQRFADLVGQQHIAQILEQALRAERVAHAYLFCGPRGIGKTSCARILAKALNCEQGPTVTPCGSCAMCQGITKGASFDVLEIDGASNRGIDEIRALRENIKFATGYGRFKIYIIDEVHMLTLEAFNALLKTLEEPPEHVKFIFATTEPHKVPATITSRCQRFDFKRVSLKTIVSFLKEIVQKEGVKLEEGALYAIGKSAQGSLRDALSILDQLCGWRQKNVTTHDVFCMLGLVETELLFELTEAIAQKNCSLCLRILDNIIDKGKDIKQLARDLTEHFRHLMVVKVGGKAMGRLIDYPVAIKEKLLVQSQQFSLKEILRSIDVFIGAQEVARITESVRMPLEVALARLTYQPEESSVSATEKVANPQKTESSEIPKQPSISDDQQQAKPSSSNLTIEDIRKMWDSLTYTLSKHKMHLATYIQEGHPYTLQDKTLTIGFHPKFKFHKESLEDEANRKYVENIFSTKLNTPIILNYILIDEPLERQDEDPAVRSVLETFGGEVLSRWHNE